MRLAVLGSRRGSNLIPIIEAIQNKTLNASIEIVLSDKADALILERAKHYRLSHQFVNAKGVTREAFDQEISTILLNKKIDLIILIGFMRIISADFFKIWDQKIINIHPSLLPLHAGKIDLAVHQSVLDAKEKESGCTVHFVTPEVDAGPILKQLKCPVFPTDTAETLKNRVHQIEGQALVETLISLT